MIIMTLMIMMIMIMICDIFQECASIEVEEHTGCVCGCDPGLRSSCEARQGRVYREEACQCQCRDIQVRVVSRAAFKISLFLVVIVVF